MNNCVFIGRLIKDPELKYTPNSQMAVCEFNIAIGRGKDKGTDFPRFKAFGKEAENLEKFKKKGDQIGIEAHVRTGSYEKDGKTIYTMDLIADRIEYLAKSDKEPTPPAELTPPAYLGSDIPF